MPFFQGARGRVHYRRWDAEDPHSVLVFLHGRGQHTGHYHRFAGRLGLAGVTLWAVDHYGHGLSEGDVDAESDGTDFDLEELLVGMAEDAASLAAMVVAEHGDVPVSLMGHSLGAATAVRVLAAPQAPDFASVVLCATPPRLVTAEAVSAVTRPDRPMLALHGNDDRIVPIETARAVLGTINVVAFDDAGHDLLHEKVHRAVTDEVIDFLPVRHLPPL